MTVLVQGAPATEATSYELWRLWLDRGLKGIEDGEFSIAIHWLRESLRHICAGGVDDRRHAMTQAHRAYAHLLASVEDCEESRDQRLSKCGVKCLSPCEEERLEKFARIEMAQAREDAMCAAPRLALDSTDLQITLAAGRVQHVLGEVCMLGEQDSAARDHFRYARKCYEIIASQAATLAKIDTRLFELDYRLQDFKSALSDLNSLESYVRQRSQQNSWLAEIAAVKADTLIQLGRYRDAGLLYPQWLNLIGVPIRQLEQSHANVYALAIFARVNVILGNYQEADKLIQLSWCLLRCLPARKDWLRHCLCHCSCCPLRQDTLKFDMAMTQAELALELGEFQCARKLLEDAGKTNPPWNDRRIRLCLACGKLHMALGCFREACQCYTEARKLAESSTPCRTVLLIPALLGQSRSDSETTNWTAAVALASQAIQCLEQRHETVTAEAARALHELAIAYVRDGRSPEARPLCDKAASLLTMTLRPNHPEEAAVWLTLAETWISRGKPVQALAALARARQLMSFGSRDGFVFARMLRLEGEAHQTDYCPDCAKSCFESAARCCTAQEQCLNCEHPERSLILLGLAVVDVSMCKNKEADDRFRVLRPMLCKLKGNAARAGFELNRRANLFQSLWLYCEADWLYCHAEELYSECYGPNHPHTQQVRTNRQLVKERREKACPEELRHGHHRRQVLCDD